MLLFHIILKNIILENVQTSEMQNLKDAESQRPSSTSCASCLRSFYAVTQCAHLSLYTLDQPPSRKKKTAMHCDVCRKNNLCWLALDSRFLQIQYQEAGNITAEPSRPPHSLIQLLPATEQCTPGWPIGAADRRGGGSRDWADMA